LLLAPPPPAPTPPPPPPEASQVVKFIPRQFDAGKLITPHSIPPIAIIKEDELPAASAVGCFVASVSPDALVRILGRLQWRLHHLLLVRKNTQTPRLRVGGIVQSAKLVRQLKPVYPQLAKQAHNQGVVKLHALISRDLLAILTLGQHLFTSTVQPLMPCGFQLAA
jgi:protein TonB